MKKILSWLKIFKNCSKPRSQQQQTVVQSRLQIIIFLQTLFNWDFAAEMERIDLKLEVNFLV